MFVGVYPVLSYRHEHSSGKELALFIEDNMNEDSYVIMSDEAVFVEYYSRKNTLVFSESKEFINKVNGLLDKHDVYFYYCKNNDELKFIVENFDIAPEFYLDLEDYHTYETKLRLNTCILYRLGKNG